jgi:hypothetical protein
MKTKNIKSFLSVVKISFKKILRGKDAFASINDIKERLKICKNCEFKIGDELKLMKCSECECKICHKIKIAASECPHKKWTFVNPS